MPLRKFGVGDVVMAKWPKTTSYYKGEVLDFNDIEYLVKFDDGDGSELAVKYKDVSAYQVFSRSRSTSRGRTPTRKSPARKSPGRKSPGRKSPGRKSPSRKVSPGRKVSPRKSSRTSRASQSEEEKTNSKSKKEVTEIPSPVTTRNRSSQQPTRQSARIAKAEAESAKPNSNNNIKVDVKTITKSVESQNQFLSYLRRVGNCYLATVKAVPMALMVTFSAFIFTQMCTKNKCSIKKFPDFSTKLDFYYDPLAVKVSLGFIFSLLVLAFVPIGKVIKASNGAKVRCNGFISLLACFLIIPVLLKMQYKLSSLYLLRHCMVTFECFGLLVAIVYYIKSFYVNKSEVNPRGNSGYYFPDFVEGRQINPRIGNLDIKFFLFRVAMLVGVMINLLIVVKDLQERAGGYSSTLLVGCALQIFFFVDWIWFEESYFTTYEYLKQGTGMIVCVGYMGMPFLASVYGRYVSNHRSAIPWYCLVGVAALNLIGYIVQRGANSQKHAFRSKPNDPALAHLESLPTSAGQRLLVSGWWGLVRHPNYLGDLLVQFSWSLLCGFNHAIPWVLLLMSVVYLIVRIFIVESQCKKKYGLAWSSYVSRVPYRLIPKVF